jgi:hypothetical protein
LELNTIKELAKENIIHLSKQIEKHPSNTQVLCQFISCFRNILEMDFFDKINSKLFIDYLFYQAEYSNVDVLTWKHYRLIKIKKILKR